MVDSKTQSIVEECIAELSPRDLAILVRYIQRSSRVYIGGMDPSTENETVFEPKDNDGDENDGTGEDDSVYLLLYRIDNFIKYDILEFPNAANSAESIDLLIDCFAVALEVEQNENYQKVLNHTRILLTALLENGFDINQQSQGQKQLWELVIEPSDSYRFPKGLSDWLYTRITDIMKILMDGGLNPNIKSVTNETLLHVATKLNLGHILLNSLQHPRPDLIVIKNHPVQQHPADPNIGSLERDIKPLFHAVETYKHRLKHYGRDSDHPQVIRNERMVANLMLFGTDPDHIDQETGMTAVHFAAKHSLSGLFRDAFYNNKYNPFLKTRDA